MAELSEEMLAHIEENSMVVEKAINDIVDTYSRELDDYVALVHNILTDENPPTDVELDDIVMRLSTLIYFTGTGCEQLGIRHDISRSAYKEAYNTARSLIQKGTVADKNAEAEIQTMAEHLVSIVYEKSYKIVKSKVESAGELLASCKKVMSRRMAEASLSSMQMNG